MKTILLKGKIVFDPDNKTRKHNRQSDWKRVAMVKFDGEICEYYSWFIEKRYNLVLNRPLRGAHITFINDSIKDLTKDFTIPRDIVDLKWEKVKKEWDGKEIEVVLDLDVKSNGQHWWMNIPHSERGLLQSIRTELGLGKPYFGMHMSLGYANERNVDHSNYILGLIQKFGGSYN